MSKILCLAAFWSVILFSGVFCAWDCTNPPKDVVKETSECCLSPDMVPDSLKKECSDKFSVEPGEFQRECLVSTCIMDKLNITSNGNFVTQSAMDLIKRTVTNDPIWEQSMEDITKGCFDFAVKNLEKGKELFRGTQIAIDISDVTRCNPLYVIFIACMEADLLTKCPDHSFMQIERCQNWKTYATDCGDDNLYLTV